MKQPHDAKRALVVIDMQMAIQQRIDEGRPHVNPEAPGTIAALAEACRAAGVPIIHVRHEAALEASAFHRHAPGFAAMPCAREAPGEAVFVKTSSSAFATTPLEAHLRQQNISTVFMVGAVAGFCVNSSARSASDLGFSVVVVKDAVIGFDLPSSQHDAQTLFEVTMDLLAADFAQVVTSADVLGELQVPVVC